MVTTARESNYILTKGYPVRDGGEEELALVRTKFEYTKPLV